MTGLQWHEKSWLNEEISNYFPDATSLKDLIATVAETELSEGRVLCEISVNDMILTEAEEGKFADNPLKEIKSFKIKSQNPDLLLDLSLAGCRDYVGNLAEAFQKAVTLFRGENIARAHSFCEKCVHGAQTFIEMMTHYKAVYEKIRGDLPEVWKRLEQELITSLSQILDAYEKKNYIFVADLFEYDVSNVLACWQKELYRIEKSGHPT